MTVKLSPQTRVFALVGLAAIVALAAMMALRSGVIGGSSSDSASLTTPPKTATAPTQKPKPATPAKPKVVLLPDLPAQIANKLRQSRVVVVSLYTGTAPIDRAATAEAKAGARKAGSGFVAVNVLEERKARAMQEFVGAVSTPSVLVVRRPGKIVTKIEAVTDSAVVAQAARNAGAGRR
jgi:hypothetical protein